MRVCQHRIDCHVIDQMPKPELLELSKVVFGRSGVFERQGHQVLVGADSVGRALVRQRGNTSWIQPLHSVAAQEQTNTFDEYGHTISSHAGYVESNLLKRDPVAPADSSLEVWWFALRKAHRGRISAHFCRSGFNGISAAARFSPTRYSRAAA
jgi:hypothetical protein